MIQLTMTTLRTACTALFLVSASLYFCPQVTAIAPPTEVHHVMYRTAKGMDKCFNKKSKEKADRCAAKLRAKGKATDVQVMAGTCTDMKR